jgi:hypothetical protein
VRISVGERRLDCTRGGTVLATALLCTCLIGCARHVILERPQADMAGEYLCTDQGCVAHDQSVPAQWNQRRTARITFDHACPHGIHSLLVRKASSKHPDVLVRCAAPDDDMIDPELFD